jgi:hypothetical protein
MTKLRLTRFRHHGFVIDSDCPASTQAQQNWFHHSSLFRSYMIFRIQQFEASDAERFAGWPEEPFVGPIRCALPAGINALELSVLETDEQGQPTALDRRRAHLRGVVATVADLLCDPTDSLVARLDGPLATGELLPAFDRLTDPQGQGRFGISAMNKLEAASSPPAGGVRIEVTPDSLAQLCEDISLGIDRGVRLRVFAIPGVLVNPLLDTGELDDERWPDILPQATVIVQNSRGLDAVQVLTRLSVQDASRRLAERLGK